ncbi:hypothetical protein HF086_009019 [Spodoptera exigua]|uniref:Uncharacterized protein n=1 Tax=Spodoptera exigua TaxID=7107 RepID=A0A922M872_SPOEX|nr:hypothetical protein HF086_009019 [Spodoptera exigua]
MAPRKSIKKRIVAKIVTGNRLPCAFCQCEVDDELTYGKLYAIGEIHCHYFCVVSFVSIWTCNGIFLRSFCQVHAPKQNIPPAIMENAKQRMRKDNRNKKKISNFKDLKELSICDGNEVTDSDTQSVCVICYEVVDGYPTVNTFWPPCCARDA